MAANRNHNTTGTNVAVWEPGSTKRGWQSFIRRWACAAVFFLLAASATNSVAATNTEIRIVEIQGTAEIMSSGASKWVQTVTNQPLGAGDKLRVGKNSRAALLWSDQSMIRFDALTELEILEPQDKKSLSGLRLLDGILSFFHRDEPGRIRILSRGSVAGIEGTEFVMAVERKNGVEETRVAVIDGKVQLSNAHGSLLLTNRQQATVGPDTAPARAPGFIVKDLVQWCFYYPAVLDPDELQLPDNAREALSNSLAAYRLGDLRSALKAYPAEKRPESDAERIYLAALVLSAGQVKTAESLLSEVGANPGSREQALAASLRRLIAAVKREADNSTGNERMASSLLASSYYEQSLGKGDLSLRAALAVARRAATNSPGFGFAWARVAELEFSFGHTHAALDAVDRSLALSPRNAQALALKGFLLAAENKTRAAEEYFNRAVGADAALANAWLGRGLCRIRRGEAAGGREDLLVAAALEPERAVLRSYLGKAYTDADKNDRAAHELALARQIDPGDPTAWLYSALLKQQQNRINDAVSDLEAAQERNDDRSLFRSRLMLDQDRAVASANLASIYRDAGMTDVAVREASRAVTYDYANSSAHLFLADSYNELRDPTRFNLRYETVWFNEFLLANILAPIGGGRLSQNLSQQEYSRLFQADGFGIANSTLFRSDNTSVTEYASQFGTFGGTSYSLDLDYQHNGGVRVNNDLDSIEWYSTIKQQITPQDTLLALIKYQDYHSGDNFQYYDPTNARPNFRFDEYQHPIAVGAWHHEWGPGMHTIVLGGRLENQQIFQDKAVTEIRLDQLANGVFTPPPFAIPFDIKYENHLEIYTTEINQIAQWDRLWISVGGRYQFGNIDAAATLYNPGSGAFLFNSPPGTPTNTFSSESFNRLTGYGYLTVEPVDRLWLTGGVAYDDLTYPANFRQPPLSSGQTHQYQTGPKAALVWEPVPQATLRGIYAQSLGGVSLDESYRLEPTQLAGFPQTFRTIISESAVGSVAAPSFEVYGPALDLKFPTKTYIGVQYQHLNSRVSRDVGLFVLEGGIPPPKNSSTLQNLDYREDLFTFSINQLLGEGFSIGASYKYDRATLLGNFPSIPMLGGFDDRAELHQAGGFILYNHPSGFFARADATWYHQGKGGSGFTASGDDFIQENLYAGYRLMNRRVELMLGILNLSGQDYHLNPITPYSELPRKRSFVARLNFVF